MSVIGCTASISLAQSTQPTAQELAEQVRELQAKIERLEAQQREQRDARDDARAVDETVERVLRDADRRSRFLQAEGFTAGWNKGKFTIQSADGNFLLNPSLQFQFRSVTNARETEDAAGDEDWDVENGFEIRRAKLAFSGNVFSPRTQYEFQWSSNRNGGELELENAYVKHELNDQWAVMGGQFKNPLTHESMMSSKRFLAVERSLVNNVFTGGGNYVQGVSVFYTREAWRAQAGFTDGNRNNRNQNFRDFPTNNANYGVVGRAEVKFA